MEIAWCMLKGNGLPHLFWVEALLNATHVFQACHDKNPYINYICVFGCSACAHVPQELYKKIDDKAVKCTFVYYSQESKGYCMDKPDT